MILIEKDGRAGGEDYYELTDNSSFVVTTYNNKNECLFLREDKKLFYVTSRIGEYVICLHFPYDNSWKQQNIQNVQDTLLNGILNIQGNAMNLNLAKRILGGI